MKGLWTVALVIAAFGIGLSSMLLIPQLRTEPRPLPALVEVPSYPLALTVDEAYAAIPHRQTRFNTSEAKMPAAEQEYLRIVFATLDQGVALRVSATQAYSNGDYDRDYANNFVVLAQFVDDLSPPSGLGKYQREIVSALEREGNYFGDWQTQRSGFPSKGRPQLEQNKHVRAASRSLRNAYGILRSRYGSERRHNQEAMFDYHCALDFL
ncbi:MAG: hypothetical protein KDA60_17855 [Planctomycetales bacterium]|nr:hypothetical protein [Planctomycetales bacterium]